MEWKWQGAKGYCGLSKKVTLDLLKETGMLGCKPTDIPMDQSKKLGTCKKGTPMDKGKYQ